MEEVDEEDANNSNHLPFDIIIANILTRLPSKSLLKFKTVCKSWNTTISDPRFVRSHLRQSRKSPSNHFVNYCFGSDWSVLMKFDGCRKLRTEKRFRNPYGSHIRCISDDGVFVLGDYSYKTFTLWSPLSRMHTRFYFPYKFEDIISHGICRGRTNNDFRVFIISQNHYTVYSSWNKTWTNKKRFPYSKGTIRCYSGVSVDGSVYWIWEKGTNVARVREIIYIRFENGEYEFDALHKPEGVNGEDEFCLACLGGRLCLYCKSNDQMTVQMWIMEKDSWKELMSVTNVTTFISLFKPLCFVEDNKIMIELGVKKVVVYCPREKKFERIETNMFEGQDGFFYMGVVPCVDSLLPIPSTRQKRKRTIRWLVA